MRRVAISLAAGFFIIFSLSITAARGTETPELTVPTEEAALEESESGLVTMDFEDAEVRDAIKVLAMASGMNMVIGEDVKAKVTISLKDMPWERALDIILRTYNFTYKKEENLIRIMTFEKVKQEERDIPLATKIIYLNFAKVSEMKSALAKSLSDRGSIEVDSRTNSMIVTDIPARVEDVEKIAATLDTRTPQVMIEAMLVDAKITDDNELGINWNIVHVDRDKEWHDKTVASAQENNYNYAEQPSSMSNLTGTAIKFGWLEKLGSFRLNGLIQAWVKSDKARILASPKVLTLNNQAATLEIILEIPYKSDMSDQGNVSYAFKEVGTKLYVTPQITSGGFVSMNLHPEMSYQSGTTDDGQPVIDTRKAQTNVLVRDGETIVIGGLRRIDNTKSYTKVPFLGDIPYLGALFRKKDLQKIETELLMFVTPHIVVKPHITPEEYKKYKWLDEMTSQGDKKEERKKAVLLLESAMPEALAAEEEKMPPSLPAIKEERIGENIRGDKDYIYVW